MKVAIVLFNLGGPDSLDAVEPFLRNLFGDPAILRLPSLVRRPLANFLARRRTAKARAIYAKIGGSSPIVGQTEAQARALEDALGTEHQWRGYVCMRYWHPMTEAVVQSVKRFAPDRIVLLPLYPQYSTTTTASSLKAWMSEAAGLHIPTTVVCCYPQDAGFVEASADLIRIELKTMPDVPRRILFSAHGLPEKVIKDGDPYQSQVEHTAAAIVRVLGNEASDWVLCYQSRVGPLKWIGPSTADEIVRAGQQGKAVVLYPLGFVSEHSETLVELDLDYRHLAEASGITHYRRAPTVGTHPAFIAGLARTVRRALALPAGSICSDVRPVQCDGSHRHCPRLTDTLYSAHG